MSTDRRKPWQEEALASGATRFRIRRNGVDVSETFDSKIRGRQWAVAKLAEIDNGEYVPAVRGEQTLSRFFAGFLATKTARSGKTRDDYAGVIEHYIGPRWGQTPINQVEAMDVAEWLANLGPYRGDGVTLSPSRVRLVYLTMKGILDLAVETRNLRANPVDTRAVRKALPTVPKKVIRDTDVPTPEQVDEMVAALYGDDGSEHRWPLMTEIQAYGALRFGEVAGLQRQDISRKGIYVVRAVGKRAREDGGGLMLKSVKDHEEREVPLARGLMNVIEDYLDNRIGHEPDALLFPYPPNVSGLVDASTYGPNIFRPALAARGLPPFQAKHLRNFGAKQWLDAGADIEELRQLMGHADIATTQRYLVAFRDSKRDLAERAYTRGPRLSDHVQTTD